MQWYWVIDGVTLPECLETRVPGDKMVRRETRYFISSLKCGAAQFQNHVRTHWSMENQCHWVLDTMFRKEHNQTMFGNVAKNLGALRRIVLNILRLDPTGSKKSLPKKRMGRPSSWKKRVALRDHLIVHPLPVIRVDAFQEHFITGGVRDEVPRVHSDEFVLSPFQPCEPVGKTRVILA